MKLPRNSKPFLQVAALVRHVKMWPRVVILEHIVILKLAILLAGLVVGLVFLAKLFYIAPSLPTPAADTDHTLNTSRIDTLELWIEERETARTNPPSLPARDYFVFTR